MHCHPLMLLIGVAFASSALSAAPVPKEVKRSNDEFRILGKWKQEFLSSRGAEKEAATATTFHFEAEGKCSIAYGDGPSQNPSGYSLDAAPSPRAMKWLNGPEKTEWRCLYEIQGDTLKVCFIDPNTEMPTAIAPAQNATIYYLKRVQE